MGTSIENVWQCLKDSACSFVDRGTVPTEQEALEFVYSCFQQFHVDPFPPQEVAVFFMREYLLMIEPLQAEGRAEAS